MSALIFNIFACTIGIVLFSNLTLIVLIMMISIILRSAVSSIYISKCIKVKGNHTVIIDFILASMYLWIIL